MGVGRVGCRGGRVGDRVGWEIGTGGLGRAWVGEYGREGRGDGGLGNREGRVGDREGRGIGASGLEGGLGIGWFGE